MKTQLKAPSTSFWRQHVLIWSGPVYSICLIIFPTHVLDDADQRDVAASHGVVLVRPEDEGPGHDDGEVVVVGEAAGAGGHLADVHPLVPLADELDGEAPVIFPRAVSHCEPLVLGESGGASAENVPVS